MISLYIHCLNDSFNFYLFLSHFSSFTKLPHLAGTEQNLVLAKKIQAQWKKFGLDSANLVHYDVLLSYPNETNTNYISIVDEHGTEVIQIVGTFILYNPMFLYGLGYKVKEK